jgi:hypothetical protein
MPGKPRGVQSGLRLAIDALDDKEDLEPHSQIVDRRQRRNEMLDDGSFAVERHQHGVERQQLRIDADGRRLDAGTGGAKRFHKAG